MRPTLPSSPVGRRRPRGGGDTRNREAVIRRVEYAELEKPLWRRRLHWAGYGGYVSTSTTSWGEKRERGGNWRGGRGVIYKIQSGAQTDCFPQNLLWKLLFFPSNSPSHPPCRPHSNPPSQRSNDHNVDERHGRVYLLRLPAIAAGGGDLHGALPGLGDMAYEAASAVPVVVLHTLCLGLSMYVPP